MELDKIYCGDSRKMTGIDDESVHLTVTSPPYYVGKKYEDYLPTIQDYYNMLYGVFDEVARVTFPGGKVIVNIGDIAVGSRYNEGNFPEEVMVIPKIIGRLRKSGVYLYARAIWEKDDPWANSSHVSFHKKVQHTEYRLLPAWEYVFIFRKGKEARKDKSFEDGRWIDKWTEWKLWVHGIWSIRSVQRNDFHEAMFPEELVRRCIKMYSFPGDVVLDPFMGSGTVAAVSKKFRRHFIGYDIESTYVKQAENRCNQIDEGLIEYEKPYRDVEDTYEDQEILFT